MAKLNQFLHRPWFHLKFKMILAMNLAVFSGVIIHVIHFCDLAAKKSQIKKVTLFDID